MKPLRLGGGSRIESHGVEKDALPVVIFEDQNDTTQPSQSIELVGGELHVFDDPEGPNRADLGTIPGSGGGGGGQVDEIIPGDFIDVDDTDPTKPIVSVPIAGTPSAGDVVVSDGAGGLEFAPPDPAGYVNTLIIRDLTAVDGAVTTSTRDSFRAPFALHIASVRASVDEESTTGDIEIDILADNSTIFGAPKLVIEQGDTSSFQGSVVPSIDKPAVADDGLIEATVVQQGTGAKGLRVYFNCIAGYEAQSVFSSTLKAADIELFGDGLVATSNAPTETGGMVLSASGKTSGKFYVEMEHEATWTSQAVIMGFHRGTSALTSWLGGNSNGWGTWIHAVAGLSLSTFHNNASTNTQTGQPFYVPRSARMAIDIDNGRIWLTRLGQTNWVGGGDPALGTSPTYTFTPGGTWYFGASPISGNPSNPNNRNRIRLVLPENWQNTAPAGFGVWTA